MNLHPAFSRPRPAIVASLLLVAAFSLALGWTAGNVAAAGHALPSAASTVKPGALTEIVPPGDQSANQPNSAAGVVGGGTGVTGSIAYPIAGYGGSLGVAPEGTILVAGTGSADVKADGSNRTAALDKATVAALADAKSQAQMTASAMGVALKGIYSISTSSSESYSYPVSDCTIPMVPTGSGATTNSAGVPALAPAGSPAATPQCLSARIASPNPSQVVVTVVVAYRFG